MSNNKIYVTGKIYEQKHMRNMSKVLEKMGYVMMNDDKNEINPKIFIDCINKADLLIADMSNSEYNYNIIWTEIGIGLALKKEIWIISKCDHNNIFFHSSVVHFLSWNEVFAELENHV